LATVTGMTAAAMQAIRDGTIVNGHFDSAGHMILTKYDGTQIDAGAVLPATTGQSGIVELATNAETQAGTDTTRAITPAGLASLPGYRAQILAQNSIAESATPAAWPYAVSMMPLATGSGWTPNSGIGIVVCYSIDSTHTVQDFYANVGAASPKIWTRSYNGAWSNWAQKMLMVNLDPTAFTETTGRGNYPVGQSRLYYTTTTAASGWSFSSLAPGEIITYIADDANFFGRQEFVQHAGGSTNPVKWFRTANQAGGWTAWQKVITDPGVWISYTPTWTTSSGTALPSLGNATVDCRYLKIGRRVDVRFEITFGSTTNFGSGAGGGDNWVFSLPVAAARTGDNLGIVELHGSGNSAICLGRARTNSTTTLIMGIVTGRVDATAIANTGDVDSISPWAWVSGNSLKAVYTYESAS
jgi:hypothetical protein